MALWVAMQECGWPAYAVLFFAIVALGGAVVALALGAGRSRHATVASSLALALALTAAALGPMGTFVQRSKIDSLLTSASIAPEAVERIRQAGYVEAAQCTSLGLGFGALPLVLASAALALAFARREPPAA